MSDALDNSIFFNMQSGVRDGEIYSYERPELITPLKGVFKNADNRDAPLAIVMHGYRGNMNGDNNINIAKTFEGQGFATMRVGFAGYDHYGLDAAPPEPDEATFISNLEDIRTILRIVPETRPVVIVGNSGSINIAQVAAADFPNVTHIAAVSPFPNIVPFMEETLKKSPEAQEVLAERKYIIPPGYGDLCKITQKLLTVGQPMDLYDADALDDLKHKPPIMIARSVGDVVAGGGALVEPWLGASSQAGYDVEDYTVTGDAHKPDADMLHALAAQARVIAHDIGLG